MLGSVRRVLPSREFRLFRTILWATSLGLVVYLAPANYTGADSLGALLTSRSILDGNSGRLESYGVSSDTYGYRVKDFGEGVRYYFPIGSSLLALPAVAIATHRGVDLTKRYRDTELQMLLSAICVGLIVLLFSVAFRSSIFAPELAAVVVASGPLSSTVGAAYWSIGPATICLLAAVTALPRDRSDLSAFRAIATPLFVCAAWLMRPTMALPGVLILGLLILIQRRRRALIIVSLLLGLALTAVALQRFGGALIPPYYKASRVGGDMNFAALLGHLISPSRGLLVFCPQLIGLAVVALNARRSRRNAVIICLGAAWFCGHWIAVSRFEHWWGGFSFGPRLMIESYLAAVLTVGLLEYRAFSRPRQKASLWLALFLAAIGMGIHVYKGLYDLGTGAWNARPVSVDEAPSRIWSWKEAQMFARREAMLSRWRRDARANLHPIELGKVAVAGDSLVVLNGFKWAQVYEGQTYYWGIRRDLEVDFQLPSLEEVDVLEVTLLLGAHRKQNVELFWGDHKLCETAVTGFAPKPITFRWSESELDRSELAPSRQIRIKTSPAFELPRLRPGWQPYHLSVSFWGLSVVSVDTSLTWGGEGVEIAEIE